MGAGQLGRVHDGASRCWKYLTFQAPDVYKKRLLPPACTLHTLPNLPNRRFLHTTIMQMPDMPVNVPIDDPNADTEW